MLADRGFVVPPEHINTSLEDFVKNSETNNESYHTIMAIKKETEAEQSNKIIVLFPQDEKINNDNIIEYLELMN